MNFALRSFSKMVYIFTPAARVPFHRSACAVRRRILQSPVASGAGPKWTAPPQRPSVQASLTSAFHPSGTSSRPSTAAWSSVSPQGSSSFSRFSSNCIIVPDATDPPDMAPLAQVRISRNGASQPVRSLSRATARDAPNSVVRISWGPTIWTRLLPFSAASFACFLTTSPTSRYSPVRSK